MHIECECEVRILSPIRTTNNSVNAGPPPVRTHIASHFAPSSTRRRLSRPQPGRRSRASCRAVPILWRA
eukprot:scaffold32412_cov112-Isochrysis_galbana.AAC.1